MLRLYDERAQVITDAVKKFGVTVCARQFNPQALGNVTPYYSWQIDRSRINLSGTDVMKQLSDTPPATRPVSDTRDGHHDLPKDPDTFGFAVWQVKHGEDRSSPTV